MDSKVVFTSPAAVEILLSSDVLEGMPRRGNQPQKLWQISSKFKALGGVRLKTYMFKCKVTEFHDSLIDVCFVVEVESGNIVGYP